MNESQKLLNALIYMGSRGAILILILGAVGVNTPLFQGLSNIGWFGQLLLKDAATGEAGQQLGFEERPQQSSTKLTEEQIEEIVREGLEE